MQFVKLVDKPPKGLSFVGVKKITDTAGFEPLDVKIKRFMLSGEIARLHESMFDSYDFREMFDDMPQVEYDGDEDIEETREKIALLMQKKREIIARKLAQKNPATPEDSKGSEGKPVEVVPPENEKKEE